jgi:hypothetical protein
MNELMTDPNLIRRLEAAARQKPSADDIQRQRLSFIISTVKETSNVTVSRIKEVLADQDGSNHP